MSFASITQRFVVWFLLISLLPILLISYSLLHTFEFELKQTVTRQISAIADKKAGEIDSYLDERVHGALVMTQSNTVQLAIKALTHAFIRGGVESAQYRRLDARYREYFKRFVASSRYYDLFLISTQGVVVYSQNHEADFVTNLFSGPYRDSGLAKVTHNAMRTLESDVSEFGLYAPSGNAVAAFVAVPIMIQGRVAGVLALQIDNARVFEVLRDRTGMGDSGETVVASQKGEGRQLEMLPLRLDQDAVAKHKIVIENPQPVAPMLRALNGERGSGFVTDYLDQPVLAAWRYLPRMRWGMVVKINTSEALAPYYRVRNFGLAALSLAFLGAVMGAILLGRRVVMPLKKLAASAQGIASGKFGLRVAVAGRDELGQLADSFNSMAERLQSSYANLEAQVRQRTAELTQALRQEQETQGELHLSETRLHEAQRIAQVGSWELDLLSGELLWSDEIFRLFEIDKSSFGATYEAFLNCIHPDDRDAVNLAYTRALETRSAYEITHRLRMSDGRIKWVNERCKTSFDAWGKPLRSLGTVQDITERKNVEQALEKSESLFRTLAQLAPVGIFRADAAGACTYVNAQYSKISGASAEAAMGTGWSEFIHPDDRARVLAEWHKAVRNSEVIMLEYRFMHPDGKVLWAAVQSRAETDAAGAVLGYVGTVTDISARKHAEEMLKNSNEELERRVENRTAMLRAAKEEAEQANKSKSLFLTSMSHELRTPLNAILGYAQLMQTDENLPRDAVENANEIRRAGDFLLNLMNDILDLSRVEAGKLQLALEAVPLNNVMQSCHSHNIQAAMSRNVTLHLAESCSACHVTADKRALTQVLNNLVSNAIKYNREGGRVSVSCEALEATGAGQDRVRISVADTGVGIAIGKQSQLFEPFNRLGAEMSNIEGTGIGLVISRKLTEGMHGAIGADSIDGQGSTFWIELPLAAGSVVGKLNGSLPTSTIMAQQGAAIYQAPCAPGQLQKSAGTAQFASSLEYVADFPARQRQAAAEPVVSRETILAAMEAKEFTVWFQPKVDAISLHTVGIEALARWELPGGRFIAPDSFISVAEREGLIGELSRLLFLISLGEAAELFAAGFSLKIAINLSGTWLNDLNLPDFILSNTVSSGLRASDVILEVSETVVTEDVTTALDVLTRLRLMGFGLSIDDFGIAYSSFEQLGRIPFTEMKLDHSFANKGVEDTAARAILESSMDMAYKLNLSTVAEGVETELDLKLIRSLGCDLAQGFFIAKPMPVKDLIVWLANAKHDPKKK